MAQINFNTADLSGLIECIKTISDPGPENASSLPAATCESASSATRTTDQSTSQLQLSSSSVNSKLLRTGLESFGDSGNDHVSTTSG